jgi:hypothetical protein
MGVVGRDDRIQAIAAAGPDEGSARLSGAEAIPAVLIGALAAMGQSADQGWSSVFAFSGTAVTYSSGQIPLRSGERLPCSTSVTLPFASSDRSRSLPIGNWASDQLTAPPAA